MEELTINIRYDYAEGQGYYFDIYDKDSRDIDYEVESLDGGICTGTLEDTLEMATEMVREIIKK